MKASRWPAVAQGSLLALLLAGLGYLAWHRYHQPSAPTYEGKALAQWIDDLRDPDYATSERAADALVRAARTRCRFCSKRAEPATCACIVALPPLWHALALPPRRVWSPR